MAYHTSRTYVIFSQIIMHIVNPRLISAFWLLRLCDLTHVCCVVIPQSLTSIEFSNSLKTPEVAFPNFFFLARYTSLLPHQNSTLIPNEYYRCNADGLAKRFLCTFALVDQDSRAYTLCRISSSHLSTKIFEDLFADGVEDVDKASISK